MEGDPPRYTPIVTIAEIGSCDYLNGIRTWAIFSQLLPGSVWIPGTYPFFLLASPKSLVGCYAWIRSHKSREVPVIVLQDYRLWSQLRRPHKSDHQGHLGPKVTIFFPHYNPLQDLITGNM